MNAALSAGADDMQRKREKLFGSGRCIPLDGNAKARIKAYVKGYNASHKQGRQHRGPITRAYEEVFEALLWSFHNSKTGLCFPSYEKIAEKAQCCRDTVYEAIKVLEDARVLTWVHRIKRIQVRQLDLFGKWTNHWKLIRTSNAYSFIDPATRDGRFRSKSENPPGTLIQEIQILTPISATAVALSAELTAALGRLEAALEEA
jgi:hypothetical protein